MLKKKNKRRLTNQGCFEMRATFKKQLHRRGAHFSSSLFTTQIRLVEDGALGGVIELLVQASKQATKQRASWKWSNIPSAAPLLACYMAPTFSFFF
jgi:hypothetical protein